MKKTVVVGATDNPARYAFRAAHMLKEHGHEIVPVGIKKGEVAGETILNIREFPTIEDVDTLTLYLGPIKQTEFFSFFICLKPNRSLFYPGT